MTTTLNGIRVLDLTGHHGELAGRILADLGATVLKIEPKTGTNARRLPPFDKDGRSLYWRSYGEGKQSCCLDVEQDQDRQKLLDLVARCDVLIESFTPGVAQQLAIDYATLSGLNPELIYMAITPYGQAGPKAHWPATDLTIEAAGGRLSIQGDTDRPPIPVGFPQAGLHGGAQAAADIIIALNERCASGAGQFLDLSMQEAMWWTLMGVQGTPVCLGDNPPGVGDDRGPRPQGLASTVVSASDGLVIIAPGASPIGTKTMFTFAMEEARGAGGLDPALEAIDWDDWVRLYRAGKLSRETLDLASEQLFRYVGKRTKLELVEWALENNLRLGPLNTTRDLVSFPQYVERDFFREIDGVTQPANWIHMQRTPLVFSPAPAPCENRIEWPARTPMSLSPGRTGLAFEGIKVADFSWIAAGPTITKALADHGATVVKIESATRPDLTRTLPPFLDGEEGFNRSYWSYLYGTSKLSLQCNLATAQGRELARKMCDWADIVVESFSPGTMERMGLGYETLSAEHPGLIMFATSMLGQTGPLRQYAGFGQQAAGFCGLHYITGWPDREPCGVASPYTDVITPKFGIAALAAAIYERRASGKGQMIDLAQAECSMLFMAPLILDEVVNGNTAEPAAMDSMYACPQGVYPCAGTERYIAIAAETTEQWHRLRNLLDVDDLQDDSYDNLAARREISGRLHRLLEAFTKQEDPWELESRLVAAGIPAAVVQRPLDVFSDPQIEARGLKQTLTHTECGDVVHYGFCTHFSAKPQMLRSAPPCLGEHNDYVLRELLGLPDGEIAALKAAHAVE